MDPKLAYDLANYLSYLPAVGSGAIAAGQAYNTARSYLNSGTQGATAMRRGRRKRKRQSRKKTTKAYKKIDGLYSKRIKGPVSSRKKAVAPSLKRRVQILEKKFPNMSRKLVINSFNWRCQTTANNSKLVNYIECFTIAQIEAAITAINEVNYTTVNSSVKVKNIYISCLMKNNTNANQMVKAAWVGPKQDSTDNYVIRLRESLIDRGIAGLPALGVVVAQSATTARIPANLRLEGVNMHCSGFEGQQVREHWKKLSPVKATTLGPGDEMRVTYRATDFNYKPEDFDTKNNNHLVDEVDLVVQIMGTLAHQNTTNPNVVAFSGIIDMDAFVTVRFTVEVNDGKGTTTYDYNTEMDDTNMDIPVIADNSVPSVYTPTARVAV